MHYIYRLTYIKLRKGILPRSKKEYYYYFPRLEREVAIIDNSRNPNYVSFEAAYNNRQVNYYNRTFLYTQRANYNLTLYTTTEQVVAYLAKYTAKLEIPIQSLRNITRELLATIRPDVIETLLSIVQRFYNRLISKRDISIQEAFYTGVSLLLVILLRTIINLDCCPYTKQGYAVQVALGGTTKKGKSLLQKYIVRIDTTSIPPLLEEEEEYKIENKNSNLVLRKHPLDRVTFFQFLTTYNYDNLNNIKPIAPRSRTRFLNYFPRYKRSYGRLL